MDSTSSGERATDALEILSAEPEYEPLDLAPWCNADASIIAGQAPAPRGEVTFHGLPFRIGNADPAGGYAYLTIDGRSPAVTVPVGRAAHGILVAHRVCQQGPDEAGPPGEILARYRITMEDGSTYDVPIRRRFEIEAAPDDHWDFNQPLNARISSEPQVVPRRSGEWHDVGLRQSEAFVELPPSHVLWHWRNPSPDVAITSIEFQGVHGTVLVAGLTLAITDEEPFVRRGEATVILTGRAAATVSPSDLTLRVDRGASTYLYSLPSASAQEFLDDPLRGWGDPEGGSPVRSAYALVSATRSATLTLESEDAVIGRFRWRDLEDDRAIDVGDWHFELVDSAKNWVRVTVVDEGTGEPVPCRVHFRSPRGVPYQPHGHDNRVAFEEGSWNIDVGGDVRLAQTTYAAINGTCEGWLPQGDVIVDVVRGFEYEPLRTVVQIAPGQQELRLELRRWISMTDHGWYSGDSHVHFLSTAASLREQMAEDLNVVNVLATQWGNFCTGAEEFTGEPVISADRRYVSYVSQENRQHLLGHLALWGLKKPVLPFCSDGLSEGPLGGALDTTLSDWADRCHDQGGTVIIAHVPRPNGETAALIATGRADAVEMIIHRRDAHRAYYDYLNCGYRVPLVGGTDKMSADVPVGLYRTYAHLGDRRFDFDSWQQAVRDGRTFVSSGPMIGLTVQGGGPGDCVSLAQPGTVAVHAWCEGTIPVDTLEVVKNGEVVATAHRTGDDRRIALDVSLAMDEDSWIAVRCGGPDYFDGMRHRDVWRRAIFAHTSPVYVSVSAGEWRRYDRRVAREMLTMIRGGLNYIENIAVREHYDDVVHHHGPADHREFLQGPFLEAEAALRARVAEWGDQLDDVG